jgi:hypothetical protein
MTEDYISIDDFIERTHKQISRSRHSTDSLTAASASPKQSSDMRGRPSWT